MSERPKDETLLQESSSLEESSSLSAQAPAQHAEAPKIPGYVLTALIGSGAYARVWKAWQARTRKIVAVKVFHRQEGVDWLLLQREVERLIRLDKHPNVVSLLDANLSGEPAYYVMDFMEGGSLQSLLDSGKRPSVEQAAGWMEDVAKALAWVHSKGVIHCDLKPANLLLDDAGGLRVADFGQSRILSESHGALGTLYYMAPEQALSYGQDELLFPDARWDVYALGATVYAALSGEPPRRRELDGVLRAIPGLPEKLKAYREGIARTPAPPLRALSGGAVDEDLSAVVDACLKPWAEERYADAGTIARDLRARREGFPVTPLAGSMAYRLRKFLGRNRVLAAVCAAAVAGLSVSLGYAVAKHRELTRNLALEYILRAEQELREKNEPEALADYRKSEATSRSRTAEANLRFLETRMRAPLATFEHNSAVEFAAFSPDGRQLWTLPQEAQSDLLVWDPSARGTVSRPLAAMAAAPPAYSGRLFHFERSGVFASYDTSDSSNPGIMVAFDPVSGRSAQIDPAPFPHGSLMSAWSSKIRGSAREDEPRAMEEPARRTTREFPATARMRPDYSDPRWKSWGPLNFLDRAAFSGDRLVTAETDKAVLWDLKSGRNLGIPLPHPGGVNDVAIAADGSRVATAGRDGTARVFDARRGTTAKDMSHLSLSHQASVSRVLFSPDGGRLLTLSADKTARLWDVSHGEVLLAVMEHGAEPTAAAFSPNGRWIATASDDGIVRVWDADARSPAAVLPHPKTVDWIAFSPDSSRLVTACRDRRARLWDVPARPESRAIAPAFAQAFAISRDGEAFLGTILSRLVVADMEGNPLWNDPRKNPWQQAVSPDASVAAVRFSDDLALLDLRTGTTRASLGALWPAQFSADGAWLLTKGDNAQRVLRVHDARTGKLRGRPIELPRAILDAAMSAGGRTTALLTRKALQVWDVDTGKLLRE
ncbi:MAG TPA: serine/threonine-protein kinase, partial [Elusimicrobiota bacterium]|nr:serine/threonine-protein kinase [Elusimicrobiota bacterium]